MRYASCPAAAPFGSMDCDDGGTGCPGKTRMSRTMDASERLLDRELGDLPPELRWRGWMLRVDVVIFASAEPVSRETLARVVGRDCSIDLLIDDPQKELRSRLYEIVAVAGGWQHRSRSAFASAIRASKAPTRGGAPAVPEFEAMILMVIAYFQPITRSDLSKTFGKEISRDTTATLRNANFLASGPRSPTPGRRIPRSRQSSSFRPSACRRCVICRISMRCRMRGCSAGRRFRKSNSWPMWMVRRRSKPGQARG
ncbi:putative transcriptional regulator [Shinella sp. DD12]|jgi:segregation and condensation protein B|nr:putative transcriptional regulator [Shinella sp. DD12]